MDFPPLVWARNDRRLFTYIYIYICTVVFCGFQTSETNILGKVGEHKRMVECWVRLDRVFQQTKVVAGRNGITWDLVKHCNYKPRRLHRWENRAPAGCHGQILNAAVSAAGCVSKTRDFAKWCYERSAPGREWYFSKCLYRCCWICDSLACPSFTPSFDLMCLIDYRRNISRSYLTSFGAGNGWAVCIRDCKVVTDNQGLASKRYM